MPRPKIKLSSQFDTKCPLLEFENDLVNNIKALVAAIEKDYSNPKLTIPDESAEAAKKLAEKLIENVNAWAAGGRKPLGDNGLVALGSKCSESIKEHRAAIEAAPGAMNFICRMLNKVVDAINTLIESKEDKITPFKVDKTEMNYSAHSEYRNALKTYRDEVKGVEYDSSLDSEPVDPTS